MTVRCKEPTEHYSSGRALLLAWDTNMNEWLEEGETTAAILAYLKNGALNQDEIAFIFRCYEDYGGDINAICPKSMEWWHWVVIAIIVLIILYMLGVRMG